MWRSAPPGVAEGRLNSSLPVMLVNDRQMLSYMSNQKLDEMIDLIRSEAGKAA